MFTTKELVWIIISIIIFEFIVLFPNYNSINLVLIISPIIIILVNVLAKKVSSGFYNIKIEHKMWEFQRYGWPKESHLKKPFPIGLILPIFITIISLGIIKPLTFLQFDEENIPEKRLLRKSGSKRKTEINESDSAFTAAWGFYALLLLSIISSLIKFPDLAGYSIYFGAWNLIPISNLDGTKLFFGSILNWTLLVIFYIIALLLIFL